MFLFLMLTLLYVISNTYLENLFFKVITGKTQIRININNNFFNFINNFLKKLNFLSIDLQYQPIDTKTNTTTVNEKYSVENFNDEGKKIGTIEYPETKINTYTVSNSPTNNSNQSENHGKWIGSLERSLIGIGIISNHWEVVSGVVAVKAVTRFKELDNKNWSEYFLIGSMISILWAIVFTCLYLYIIDTYFHDISSMLHIITENKKNEFYFLNQKINFDHTGMMRI